MLKQYLTKVIAVATIAAGAVFVAGRGAEETNEENSTPDPKAEEGEKENPDAENDGN